MILDKIRCALNDRVLMVVAEKTGLSTRTVSNVKHGIGDPHPSTVKVLAMYLGVEDE